MLKNVSQNIRIHTYFNEHNYILSTNRSEFYLYRAGTLRSKTLGAIGIVRHTRSAIHFHCRVS